MPSYFHQLRSSLEQNLAIKTTTHFARFIVDKLESRIPPIILKADEMDQWIDQFLYGPDDDNSTKGDKKWKQS